MLDLLAALRLADSFFPSGMFTQSHGLEQFVAAGARRGADRAA
ncbi:MAG: urease accessory protein, partial [Chloroflexales bacterium]|nr:urease accessory protein [Chloroflexales bacterium]